MSKSDSDKKPSSNKKNDKRFFQVKIASEMAEKKESKKDSDNKSD